MKKFLFVIALALTALCAFLAPQETLNVLGVLAVLALTLFVFANTSRLSRRNALIPACNTLAPNWGTHTNGISLLSSAAVATRYLLGKRGADVDHVAVLAATADQPLGVMTDEASAAEESINVELLGVTNKTVPVVAKVAITLDADLYGTADGKVGIKPTAAGTYWRVGRAMQAADAENDVIEMLPCKPRKLIVIAALGNANSEISDLTFASVYTASELTALKTKAEELADDVRAIAAALNGDADVALATT